jgi:AGCS family alanine or glycine:cation symporter
VWDIADTLNGLMAIPNLIALLLLYKVITTATKDYIKKKKSALA